MTNKETQEQLKCDRCDSDKPALIYDPRTPGHPNKRVNLCDECAVKDNKAVLVGGPGVPPEVTKDYEATIGPEPILDDVNEIETIKFEPKTPEAIEERIVTPKSKLKSSENLAENVETKPIDRVDIENKIKKHEKDLDTLLAKRREIQGQLEQVSAVIAVTKGAVAGLRDLLGNV